MFLLMSSLTPPHSSPKYEVWNKVNNLVDPFNKPPSFLKPPQHFLMWWTSTTGGIIPSLIILIAVIVVFRSLKNNMGDNARYKLTFQTELYLANPSLSNLDKYISQFGQIHFATNILWQTCVQHHASDQRLLPHLGHPHHLPHDLLPVQSANYLQVGFHLVRFPAHLVNKVSWGTRLVSIVLLSSYLCFYTSIKSKAIIFSHLLQSCSVKVQECLSHTSYLSWVPRVVHSVMWRNVKFLYMEKK